MNTELLGIVGHVLFISPFYAGDHVHESTITSGTKADLIERGVKEFPSRQHIDATLYGMSYEEYTEWKQSFTSKS